MNALTALDNLSKIQRVFFTLLSFAKDLKEGYPNPPGDKENWRIKYCEIESTFCLFLGSAIVYVDTERDDYTIDFLYNHIRRDRMRVADSLPRQLAIDFLNRANDSRLFPAGTISKFGIDDEGSQDLIRYLLETVQTEKVAESV